MTGCGYLSVYVMLAESFEFRALLDALKGRGLLETGEYIVLGVDSKHYDSKDPQKYIAGTCRTTEYLPMLIYHIVVRWREFMLNTQQAFVQ